MKAPALFESEQGERSDTVEDYTFRLTAEITAEEKAEIMMNDEPQIPEMVGMVCLSRADFYLKKRALTKST